MASPSPQQKNTASSKKPVQKKKGGQKGSSSVQLKGKSFDEQQAALAPGAQGFDVQRKALLPIQMKGGGRTEAVHAAAERGTSGGGGALPYLDKIQSSFGAHDVSNVQAPLGVQRAALSPANQLGSEGQMLQLKPVSGTPVQKSEEECVETPAPIDGAPMSLPDGVADLNQGTNAWTMRLSGFDYDTAGLRPAHLAAVTGLKRDADAKVAGDCELLGWNVASAVGHASPEGEENYNAALAQKRAAEVLGALGSATAPTSSGEACAAGTGRDRYPYYRAVDLRVEFYGQSVAPDNADKLMELRATQSAVEADIRKQARHFERYAIEAASYGSRDYSEYKKTHWFDHLQKGLTVFNLLRGKGMGATDMKVAIRTKHALRRDFEKKTREQAEKLEQLATRHEEILAEIEKEESRTCD